MTPEKPTTDNVDRFTYEGNHFPWWMLIIWIAFIMGATFYMAQYMIPNLNTWVQKPPYSHFEP